MILAILLLCIATYITYLGITAPQKASKYLRVFSFDAAVATDESRIERLTEIADKYYQTRDLLAAEKAYLRILKLDHHNFTAFYRLGLIYSYLNNNSDALECFEIATQIKPTATTLHNYGMTLFRYRDYPKAIEVLERANAKKPSLTRHITLARIYSIQNDRHKQLEHMQAANTLEKRNPEVMLLLAEAYLHNDNQVEADKIFRQVLRIDPSNQRARQALAH